MFIFNPKIGSIMKSFTLFSISSFLQLFVCNISPTSNIAAWFIYSCLRLLFDYKCYSFLDISSTSFSSSRLSTTLISFISTVLHFFTWHSFHPEDFQHFANTNLRMLPFLFSLGFSFVPYFASYNATTLHIPLF